MKPEQSLALDMMRAAMRELELVRHYHAAQTIKSLENPAARQYGALVGRGPEVVEITREPAKLATDSGVFRLR